MYLEEEKEYIDIKRKIQWSKFSGWELVSVYSCGYICQLIITY